MRSLLYLRADVRPLATPLQYLAQLTLGMTILWCYLIWYSVTLAAHFDPSPRIWLSSLGISAIIGFALLLSIRGESAAILGRWQRFRLFLMPFCVSSFSALIKGQGYFLVFPTRHSELYLSIGLCAAFGVIVWVLRIVLRDRADAN